MLPLRLKLKQTVSKWRAMVKRRIHPEDDLSEAALGPQAKPHKSKQQRAMTDQKPGGGPLTSSEPQALAPPPPSGFFSSPNAFSPPAPAGTMGVPHSSETDESDASGENLADLPGTSSSLSQSRSGSATATDQASSFSQQDIDAHFPHDLDMEVEQTTQIQIKNDQQMALLLQEQLDREGEGFRVLDNFGELAELAELRTRLQLLRCVKCKTRIHVKADDVIRRARDALRDARMFHPCFRCRDCKGWSCIGEDTYYAGDWAPKFPNVLPAADSQSAWCCNVGRLFLVFSLLCGPETISPPSTPNKVTKPRSKSDAVPSSSTQTGQSEGKWRSNKARTSLLSKGTGYGDCAKPPTKIARSRASQGNKEGAQDMELYFRAISPLLRSKASDNLRQPALAFMVQRSPMLHHASELLRHAAIEEINAKPVLVAAVLDFVETVASHADPCPVLLRPRIRFPLNEQLALAVLGDADRRLDSGSAQHETVQSVLAIIDQLAVPCRKFVLTSTRFGGMGVEENDGPLLELMQRICSMANTLGRFRMLLDIAEEDSDEDAAPPEPSPSLSRPASNVTTRGMLANAAKEAEEAAIKDITRKALDWHRESCVKEVPDDVILKDFHFASLARTAEKSKPAPGRMRKLLAQVSSLSADLPDGIFVRHGESRVDVLKVLITGPVGTPYEHGIFEFDMFCSAEFPKEPPKMFFRTTGEGRVSFNPNLYPTGKICLSLLGTWSGQPWEPERSTILQVLVSIQAMVFNDQPFYNEPGYEYHADRARAEEYNRNIEGFTITHAMIPWLRRRLVAPRPQSSAPDTSTPAPSSPTVSTPATPVVAVAAPTTSMPPVAQSPAQQLASQLPASYHTAAQKAHKAQQAAYQFAVQQQLANQQAAAAQQLATQHQTMPYPLASQQPATSYHAMEPQAQMVPMPLPAGTAIPFHIQQGNASASWYPPGQWVSYYQPAGHLIPANYAAPSTQHVHPPPLPPPPAPQSHSFTSAAPELLAVDMANHYMTTSQNNNNPLQQALAAAAAAAATTAAAAGSSAAASSSSAPASSSSAASTSPHFIPPPVLPASPSSAFAIPPPPAPVAVGPPVEDPIWAEVVRAHFSMKAPLIRKTLARFEKSARAADRGLSSHVSELEGLLRKHGFCD